MKFRCGVVCALRRIVAPAGVVLLRQVRALSLMSGDRSEDIGVLIAELLPARILVNDLPTSRSSVSPARLQSESMLRSNEQGPADSKSPRSHAYL